MNKKILYIIFVLGLVVTFIIGFQIGKKQQKTFPNNFQNNKNPNFQMNGDKNRIGQNNTSGEVIDKNENSITIKTNNAGSKIIVISKETELYKTIVSSLDTLNLNDQVMVIGKTNEDGSIIADSIRILGNLPSQSSKQLLPAN